MSNFNEVMLSAFYDEMEKVAAGKLGLGLAAAAGGATMYGAAKGKKMYALAKKEQGEQEDARQMKRMQALQARMALRKQYGKAFSEG